MTLGRKIFLMPREGTGLTLKFPVSPERALNTAREAEPGVPGLSPL